MTWLTFLCAGAALILFVYLVIALIKPEIFP